MSVIEREYPYDEGDVTVLGPECFVARDGSVLCWKGVNYVPQDQLRGAVQALRELLDAGAGLASWVEYDDAGMLDRWEAARERARTTIGGQ